MAPWIRTIGGPWASRGVALLFADGPNAYHYETVDILAEQRAKATFAVVGRWIAGNEGLLRRMLAYGNAIANHSWSHPHLTAENVADEIARTQVAIRNATGYTPCVFRPPHGDYGRDVVQAAKQQDLVTIDIQVNTWDWAKPGTEVIYHRVMDRVRRGAIFLLHPSEQTNAVLPRIIDDLRVRGYHLHTVPRLLGLTNS